MRSHPNRSHFPFLFRVQLSGCVLNVYSAGQARCAAVQIRTLEDVTDFLSEATLAAASFMM